MVKKDLAAWVIPITRQVAAPCFLKVLFGLDPNWQPGREMEPSIPRERLYKA